MLLRIKDITGPRRLRLHEVEPLKEDGSNAHIVARKSLVPIKGSGWPDEVTAKINDIFRAIGVEDPYRQKLVEPYAFYFGGRDIEGKSDLSGVYWEMVVDYFTWEAACWDDSSAEDPKL